MANIEHPAAYEAATRRNIINNARTTFIRTVQDAVELIQYVHSHSGEGKDFYNSLCQSLDSYGKLTEKQCAAVRNSMMKETERKAQWAADAAAKNATRKYLGEVGKKIQLTITVKAEIRIERMKFHYYDSGVSLIRICEDVDGNVITFNGTADFPAKGETAVITATVKSHKDYKGTPQTVITRPKFVA